MPKGYYASLEWRSQLTHWDLRPASQCCRTDGYGANMERLVMHIQLRCDYKVLRWKYSPQTELGICIRYDILPGSYHDFTTTEYPCFGLFPSHSAPCTKMIPIKVSSSGQIGRTDFHRSLVSQRPK